MTSDALPSRDLARPVLRVAFAVGWLVGALLVAALVATVANAASLKGGAPHAPGTDYVRQAPLDAPCRAVAAPTSGCRD